VTPAERVAALNLEADRLKARLDQFEKQISGDPDAWLSIVARMPDDVGEVVVDKLLTEARQTALAYTTVVKTLNLLGDGEAEAPKSDPVDEVRKRREQKLADAAKKASDQL
jgi:hypothetical protein